MPVSFVNDAPKPERGRPTVGMLYGLQIYGTRVIYGFIDGYIDSVARGIHAAAHDRNANLLLSCGMQMLTERQPPRPAWPTLGPETDFLPVGPWNTDGIVVVHPLRCAQRTEYVRKLGQSGFPIIHVGTADGGPAIGMDNDIGLGQAVRHLVGHGHRRIAFVAGYENDLTGDSGQRLRAFKAAAAECGLEVDPRLIAFGNHRIAEGRAAMQQIIDSGAPFSAVMASNDSSAFGAMQVLTESGRRIPHDVALVGFDDRPEGTFSLPPLTTVHQPVFERGYHAAMMLLDAIEGKRALDERIVNLPTRLVVRRSCGCMSSDVLSLPISDLPAAGSSAQSFVPLRAHLTRLMIEAIVPDSQRLNIAELSQMLRRLVDAFIEGLERADPGLFSSALQAMLARVEKIGGNMSAWIRAIEAMEHAPEFGALLSAFGAGNRAVPQSSAMLDHARQVIYRSARRQQWREQYFVFEENELLATRLLLSVHEEHQILHIMAEHLPSVGIPRSAVVLFEAEEGDPVAWSLMRSTENPDGEPIRFRTREFPPPAFAPAPGGSSQLVLLPLTHQNGPYGYVVFDTYSLELCASLAHAVYAALRSAHMHREADSGRRMAEDVNRLKSRFLSMVSHELRTPISVILAASELLAVSRDADAAAPGLARIRASAQHLDGLIRDVLDLAVDEIGELRLNCEPLDLGAVLDPVIVVGEHLAVEKGLRWRAEVDVDVPQVWADRARLRQVVLNLITNAVKYTPRGEVSLRVYAQAGRALIAVQDSGIGVAPQERQAIFDEFRKSSRPAAHGPGGLGLGLAISRRLVELHGGEIDVQSDGVDGEGACFRIALPRLEVTPERIAASISGTGPVWLIGDDMDGSEQVCSYLARREYDVRRVEAHALPGPRSSGPDAPGSILVEASLAQRLGPRFIRQLNSLTTARDAPVLFFALAPPPGGEVDSHSTLSRPIGTADLAEALDRGEAAVDGERTILVVEDDPGLLDMHARIIEGHSSSWRVLRATGGVEALALAQQHRLNLVVLDLVMPDMDGFEVLERLRKLETRRHVPVIALTAQALSERDTLRLNRAECVILAKGVFTVQETMTHIERVLTAGSPLKSEVRHLAHKAMAYIHERYTQPLTRAEIAAHVQVNEDHLTRCFRLAVAMPPMTYLTRYRVNRAKELLARQDRPVADVASSVGFASEFHFSYVFKRLTGLSPSAYRRTRL